MRRTFDCGVGFGLAVDPVVAKRLMERLIDQGEEPFVIGELGVA